MRSMDKFYKTTVDIIQTVYELLQSKNKDEISVVDVCKKMDINRSTFYAHFDNIESVYRHIDFNFVAALKKIPSTEKNVIEFNYVKGLIESFAQHKEFFKKYYSFGLTLRLEPLFEGIYERLCPKAEGALLAKFFSAAVNDFIEYWVTNDPDKDIDDIVDGFMNAVLPTIRKFRIVEVA